MLRSTWPRFSSRAARALRMLGGWTFGLLLLASAATAWAAPFDLSGPSLDVRVTRAGRTLPIAEVPSLAAGDQIEVEADLPPGESVHYLLVTAFLRGATNPPPESWFARTAAWKPQGRAGLRVTVPEGAEQALVFLAPQTGGDFKTLVGAVRSRPGAFVRASQELGQASLDRARLDAFTAAVGRINQIDPQRLKSASPLLARSLGIRIDDACLKKVSEVQASCLTQDRDSLVLEDDPQSTSRLALLASGYSAELVRELSSTPWAGAGNYSPYIASLIDVVHLFDASRTAQYQYIPALGVPSGPRMSLLLNAPPSFHNPKSVLVVALPAIRPQAPPQLRPLEPDKVYCASKPDLLLPIEGAPLVFSSAYVHDLALHLSGGGTHLDLPARPDPERGGLVVDVGPAARWTGPATQAVLTGEWGFSPFPGPSFHVVVARPQTWAAEGTARSSLVVGQETTVRLNGEATACVGGVSLEEPSGAEIALSWSAVAANQLEVKLPPKPAGAGDFKLLIRDYGASAPDIVPLGLYAQPPVISAITYHQGDREAVLAGERLDEVKSITLGHVRFEAAASGGADVQLRLSTADDAALERLATGERLDGEAELKDGRTIAIHATIAPPRPLVSLISKDVETEAAAPGLPIKPGDPDALPRRSRLTFSIRADGPTRFTGRETVEVRTADGGFSSQLTAASGLMLQDAHVAVASLDLAQSFGRSAFGPLQFRVVKDGVGSAWAPLGDLVRLPQVSAVRCPAQAETSCSLEGSDLFLIAAVSATSDFAAAVDVPDGYARAELKAPRPIGRRLYLKLRDDPAAPAVLTLPAETEHRGERGPRRAAKTTGAKASAATAKTSGQRPGAAGA